jgi:hypothetical protein
MDVDEANHGVLREVGVRGVVLRIVRRVERTDKRTKARQDTSGLRMQRPMSYVSGLGKSDGKKGES